MLRLYTIAALETFDLILLAYFLTINTIYLIFSVMSYLVLRQHRRRWTSRA